MPLGLKQQVGGTIGSLGRTTFWKWQQRRPVLEEPVRRDLSEGGKDRDPRASKKGNGHSPRGFLLSGLLRIIQVENSTHCGRFHPHSAKSGGGGQGDTTRSLSCLLLPNSLARLHSLSIVTHPLPLSPGPWGVSSKASPSSSSRGVLLGGGAGGW